MNTRNNVLVFLISKHVYDVASLQYIFNCFKFNVSPHTLYFIIGNLMLFSYFKGIFLNVFSNNSKILTKIDFHRLLMNVFCLDINCTCPMYRTVQCITFLLSNLMSSLIGILQPDLIYVFKCRFTFL